MPLPGLSNNEKRYFLGIKEGRITYRPGRNIEPETYDHFEGILKSIVKREANINGKTMLFYDFTMVNQNTYVLSLPMDQSVARSLVLCLASVKNFGGSTIKINPYLKDGKYTNVAVYCNGEKLNWPIEKLPETKKFVVSGKEFVDDSERIALVESYVNIINDRLQKVVDVESGEFQSPMVDIEDEDMPESLG